MFYLAFVRARNFNELIVPLDIVIEERVLI